MVLGIEDYDESASNHYLLFSCRWLHKICSGPLLWVTTEGVQSQLVETSSSTGVNKAQLVGTHNGRVIVPIYDWISFLGQYFKKLPNITKFHHFRFSQENPSMVFYKGFVSSPEQSFMLLKRNIILPPSLTLPNKINPEGLTEERKNYLYRKIRQFCKTGTEDLVAPAP